MKFRLKKTFDAIQLPDDGSLPPIVKEWIMAVNKSFGSSIQSIDQLIIEDADRLRSARPGDWIVKTPRSWIGFSETMFQEKYVSAVCILCPS